MRVLYCADPLERRSPDSAYQAEASAAATLCLDYDLIDYEALVDDGDPQRAVRSVAKQPTPCLGIYRG